MDRCRRHDALDCDECGVSLTERASADELTERMRKLSGFAFGMRCSGSGKAR